MADALTAVPPAQPAPAAPPGLTWRDCFAAGMTARAAALARGLHLENAYTWAYRQGVKWPNPGQVPRPAGDGSHIPRVDDADLEPLPPIMPRDLDLASCRRIWCAVLLGEWRAVFIEERPRGGVAPWKGRGGGRNPRDMTALRWFGSRDFHMVCALAGFDGAAVLDRFRARCRERGVAA